MPSPFISVICFREEGTITCKKARIWTFFWSDRNQYGWFALLRLIPATSYRSDKRVHFSNNPFMKLICPGFSGGLTVVPPLETCQLFWANFAFTTIFSSWKMVLQPKYKLYQYDICPLQKKTQQRTNNRTFYKYKKSERDFLVRAIRKISYRLRNALCCPLHVLLQTFPCSYTPLHFLHRYH